MRTRAVIIFASTLLLLCGSAMAQKQPAQPAQAEKPGLANPVLKVDEKPLTTLPYTPSLDLASMDKTAD
ncbi:MAG: hypothetical protein ACM3SW_07725, partial [Actinomycetota bacterium]